MKLSIICPIYNGAKTVSRTVRSVLDQDFQDFELLLIDDGSVDESGSICDSFAAADSRIKAVHVKNSGVAFARNVGLQNAQGEFTAFIDADDVCFSNQYSLLVDALESNLCDIAMGGYCKRFSSESFSEIRLPYEGVVEGDNLKKIISSMAFWNAFYNGEFLPSLFGAVWSNLYRTSIIRENDICFPEGINIGEDLIFNIDYLSKAKSAVFVPEPLYEYNLENESATRKRNFELWHRYITLNGVVSEHLSGIVSDDVIELNRNRQTIYYAVSHAEEQICVFLKGRERKNALRDLCADDYVQKAASFLIKNGASFKEKIQALLFKWKLIGLIDRWLRK